MRISDWSSDVCSSDLGKFVPRADGEAIIAAIDAVADPAPQRDGDRAIMLDREIGDAAPRIEAVRRGKGVGRARLLARRTAAAPFAPRHRRRQIDAIGRAPFWEKVGGEG